MQLQVASKKIFHLNNLLRRTFLLALLMISALPALGFGFCYDLKGKIDISPAYVHVDVLESGQTRHRMDLPAIKGDATIMLPWYGFCVKPNILYGINDGYLLSGGVGLGHYTPVNEWLAITPVAGVIFSKMSTETSIEIPLIGNVYPRETYRSESIFAAMEFNIKFSETWRAALCYQFAWSHSQTHIKFPSPIPLLHSDDHTQGSSFSGMIEKDINKKWSVNLGGAYNSSLTKEKHGLRAYGFKLGIAYWL